MTLYPNNNDKEVNPNYVPPASKAKRELIDRGQIQYTWWELNGKLTDGVTLQSVIRAMPTVDAVEVAHGRWIEHPKVEFINGKWISNYECSECCCCYRTHENYCGYCGAKMDGDIA